MMRMITSENDDHVKLEDKTSLLCPCGSNKLHQKKVDVMFRFKEDGDGLKTTSTGGCGYVKDITNTKSEIKYVCDKEIPKRRDSIEITFSCEDCDNNTILQICQHKGINRILYNIFFLCRVV